MQIHEITRPFLNEGFWGDLKTVGSTLVPNKTMASGFVQGLSGADLPQSQPPVDVSALKTAAAVAAPATERIVVTVSQPGQTVPAKYFKTKNVWTNELGTAITNPRQTAYLEKLIPTHGEKETIAPPPVTRKISRRRTVQ